MRRRRIGRNHRDEDRNDSLVVHPEGEQPEVEAWSAVADTYAGRVHVEWDATAPVTPFGQLPFFIEYLKQGGLFDGWVRIPGEVARESAMMSPTIERTRLRERGVNLA